MGGFYGDFQFRQLVAPERGDVFDESKTEGLYASKSIDKFKVCFV